MTDATTKESIMASLILSSDGAARENEGAEQLVTAHVPGEDSLFATVPIAGDAVDDGLAGAFPFSVSHGETQIKKPDRNGSEIENETYELGGASFVGREPGGLLQYGMLSDREQEVDCSASSGNGVHPNQLRIVAREQQNMENHNQARSFPEKSQSITAGSFVPEEFGNQPSGGVRIQSAEFTTDAVAHNALPRANGGGIISPQPPGSGERLLNPYQQNAPSRQDQIGFSGFVQASRVPHSQHNTANTYAPNVVEQQDGVLNHSNRSRLNLHSRLAMESTAHQSSVSFASIVVSDPLLISSSGVSLFGIRQPPHWSYQVQTSFQPSSTTHMGCWVVRRRFRHVVALEERLRQECPGAILPPRPDKHATRALEEATAHQSTEFALHRALELQIYLNSLAHHPYAMHSNALRLFLSLQDDLGTAWVEVSSNTLTRLANVGVGAAIGLSESTTRGLGVFRHDEYLPEDSAELISLQAAEATRMGAVSQAVPKLEGCIALLREHVELAGAAGLEFQKAKLLEDLQPLEVLSNGILRSARRTRRSVTELMASAQTFVYHCKLVRYEQLAFADRKQALLQRASERGKADQRAAQLVIQQRRLGGYSTQVGINELEREASFFDQVAVDKSKECEDIGNRVISEVARTANDRRTEWEIAVRAIAKLMKEATSERVSIWTSARDQYMSSFPDL